MAILERRNIKINPIDLPQNDKVAVGVTFPFDGPAVFNSSYTTKEQVKSNLINLLLTHPGERVNLPKFGIGVKNLLFEQQVNLELLKEKITTQTSRHIPQIEVIDVKTGILEDKHTVFVSITYRSLLDQQDDSIQLNFN